MDISSVDYRQYSVGYEEIFLHGYVSHKYVLSCGGYEEIYLHGYVSYKYVLSCGGYEGIYLHGCLIQVCSLLWWL
jgi:hypothetical protein